MRISVVIIVFNLEAYVSEAVESVMEQTRQADEIIVVDDCSTDRSPELIRRYGRQVKYLRMKENSGALLAALTGVKASTGDVVAMLDGDDIWAANKLEVVEREFLAQPELMLLSHNHVRVDGAGKELFIRDDTHRNIAGLIRKARSPGDLSVLLRTTILDQRGYWLGSAYSFRKSLFDIRLFEDQISVCDQGWLKQTYLDLAIAPFLVLTKPSGLVGYTQDTTFFYRIHDAGSLGGNVTPDKAIKSAKRGRSINELIYLLLCENKASPKFLERRSRILASYDYLLALYQGRFVTAFRLYAHLAMSHWTWRELTKETIRFLGVSLLGPGQFLARK